MKLRTKAIGCALMFAGCGGAQVPAAPSNSASAPKVHTMDHATQPGVAATGNAPSIPEPTAAQNEPPAVSTAPSVPSMESPASASAASTGNADTSNASDTSTRGTLSIKVTSTPVKAAMNAVAYLENGPLDREVTGTLDNRQMTFVPYVLVVTVGSKVTFKNSDPFPHNVFSPDQERWDMGVVPAGAVRARKFEKAGVYTALCNMHPNMKAYILVTPSSYFAKADKTGAISMKNVPVGAYKLVTWAPGVKAAEQGVTVHGGDVSLSIELHR